MTIRLRTFSAVTVVLLFFLHSLVTPREVIGQASVQGRWSTAPNQMPLNPIHVALLPNSKILVVAGSGDCPPSQTGCPSGAPYSKANGSGALLWDPTTENYTQWFSLSWDMFCNGMVLLKDGRAFIDSGTIQYDPFYGQPKSSIFDPSTNSFSDASSMAHGRWYPTLVTLGDGRVMTFSGVNETGGTNTAVEIYTVGSGWSTQYIAPWTPPLYPRLHVLPNGTVFYSGSTPNSAIFNPAKTTWTTNVATTNYSGTRTYGSSVLLPLTPVNNYDPKIMIMGGNSPATNTTEIIDMGASSPKWVWGPNMSQARIDMNAVILPNGKVLAVGGSVHDEDTSSLSLNADLYDPATNTFSSAGANATQRLYHSVALLLPDATVWLAGGNPSRGTYNKSVEIYKPRYLFNSDGTAATRPSITGAPSSISYGKAFTVTTPDSANISSVVLVRNGTVTHSFGMDQREVGLTYTVVNGALSVTAPPNGNIAPPGYYMLFLLNNSGVPSVARFVQLTTGTPGFSISATPATHTTPPGSGTGYTVNITGTNGFLSAVGFSVTGLPAGATPSFSPATVTGSGSSTLSIATTSSVAIGTYPLTITATSGNLSHSTQVTLVVANLPSFSISASPKSQTLEPGSWTTYVVTVTRIGPFSSAVTFALSGLPKRTSSTFSPASVSGSGSSTLTIAANKNATPGTYTLTITGSGGGLARSIIVTVTIP